MKVPASGKELHSYIYRFSLVALVCFLPLSRYLLSIAQFLLVVNWLLEGEYKKKITLLYKRREVLLFASLFFVYVIGSFYSDNFPLALTKIKNTLPFLAIPLIIGSSSDLSEKFIKSLLLFFVYAVILAAVINLIHYFRLSGREWITLSQTSLFMSHIRFSLLVNMAIFILYCLVFRNDYTSGIAEKILYSFLAISLVVFLFILGSMAGIIICFMLMVYSITDSLLHFRTKIMKTMAWMLASFCLLTVLVCISIVYFRNFQAKPVQIDDLDARTINGNLYDHNTEPKVLENGHYIDIYVCEKELRQEWNKISNLSYDGPDRKGQSIAFTLKRYLTSMGFRKDSLGTRALTSTDIASIENGMTNYLFNTSTSLFTRLYETLWELQVYIKTGYVQDHSFTQRLVFLKLALKVTGNHPLFGVGTGDVRDVMLYKAEQENILLEAAWEGKPHNQFTWFILAFGMTGFVWIAFSWIYPVVRGNGFRNYLLNVFLIIIVLSMLIMDTLESYDSIVFFTFFYSLFVLSDKTR